MSDAALDKLFEEMRAVIATDAHLAKKREQQANIGKLIDERIEKSRRRKRILDETLRLHIHEGMTVLAAKMAAPEKVDAENTKAKASINSGYFSIQGSIAQQMNVIEAAIAKREARKRSRYQRFLAWLFKKLGGAA